MCLSSIPKTNFLSACPYALGTSQLSHLIAADSQPTNTLTRSQAQHKRKPHSETNRFAQDEAYCPHSGGLRIESLPLGRQRNKTAGLSAYFHVVGAAVRNQTEHE